MALSMHWLLELPVRVKFQLTTLISYLIMDTLLTPFLSLSYFLSGVSWYHLLSELFALKFLFQGLVLEMLVPGELRLLLCCERIWRWSDSKKWVCLERNTLHGVWAISRRRERASKYGVISFYGLGNFIGLWVGGLFQLFRGGGWDFQELGHHPLFGLCGQPQSWHGAGGCIV